MKKEKTERSETSVYKIQTPIGSPKGKNTTLSEVIKLFADCSSWPQTEVLKQSAAPMRKRSQAS